MTRRDWLSDVAARASVLVAALCTLACGPEARAAREGRTWYVDASATVSGTGERTRPFVRLSDALEVAGAGDTVEVAPGTYAETLRTTQGGAPARPLVVRGADPSRRPVFQTSGRVATIAHPHVVLENLVLDGSYGADDAVRVATAADHLVLRRVEVRRAGRDCIDMGGPADVLLDEVLIHHCLDGRDGRTDAHGLVAGAVTRLTVRHASIHTFSGDGIQIDPGRTPKGWTGVTVEASRIWLAPLEAATNGFAAGTVPGENAIDTKTPRSGPRATLTVTDVEAWGFDNGLIPNMAAFNIKERVDATFDGVTVHHSAIGFRVRGPGDRGARVTLRNAVLHHLRTAIRYEDDIAALRVEHATFGRAVDAPMAAVQAPAAGVHLANLLILAPRVPPALGRAAVAVDASAFVDASRDEYRLAVGRSPARGPALDGVTRDRAGRPRPPTGTHAIGAYEP